MEYHLDGNHVWIIDSFVPLGTNVYIFAVEAGHSSIAMTVGTLPTAIKLEYVKLTNSWMIIATNITNSTLTDFKFPFLLSSVSGTGTSFSIVPIGSKDINNLYRIFTDCAFYYDMNNVVVDVTGNTNAIARDISKTTNRFDAVNRAYNFPGNQSNHIQITPKASLSLAGDYCVFIIVGKADVQDEMYFFNYESNNGSYWTGFDCGIDTDSNLFFNIYIGGTRYNLASSEFTIDDSYYYISFQRSGSAEQIYINGVLNSSNSASNSSQVVDNYLYIGCDCDGIAYPLNANIDCAIGWNRALTEAEHKMLYDLFKSKNIYPTTKQKRQRGM
jgi:hypothetical protein